jgi:PAS domain S-box-containing protein
MDKRTYIEQEILRILQHWGGLAALYGSLVIIALSIMDYFVAPAYFSKFFLYRLAASALIMVLYFMNKQKMSKYYQTAIFITATFVVSVMVELMVLSFGGHQSSYYVGMIIVLMFTLGFIPWFSFSHSLMLAATTYLIYLVPILMLDTITNLPLFINNNIFLFATASICIAWRYYNDKLLIEKLSLEYDLSQEKEQLQQYSTQLEALVAERTKELEISEQRYRELFDSANDGIVVFDENNVVVDVNRQFCGMYGFDKRSLVDANLKLLEVEEYQNERNERMKRILNGEALVFETEHYKKNGDKLIVEVSSKAIEIRGKMYVQSFHRDITDKKRLLEQLFQAQKMESIGILAGGIAHDFNNFLGAILGSAELLGLNENLDATSRSGVRIIESAARKAGQIVSKLLSFARKGKFNALPLNFNDVLRDAVELIERIVAKKKAVLKVEITDNIPIIKGDSTQLEQVIMNLVINAADAMPEGGTITLSTSLENIVKNHTLIHPLLTPGKYVCLRVSDTGTGIPDKIRDNIFDPFFTTKGPEKGTGLGLAIIYGIVREHKGVITVTSLLGRGTTFKVYLPAMESGFFAELS